MKVEHLKDGLNVAELFHGPTLTFKDLGLTIVAKMYDYFLEKRKRHMTVLVGETAFLKPRNLVSPLLTIPVLANQNSRL